MIQARLLTVIGLGLLPVAVAGLVLPLLPGTPILLLASVCLARGSPRFHRWLTGHAVLGPPVRLWRERRAIPRSAKTLACLMLLASMIAIALSSLPILLKIGLVGGLAGVAVYILGRPGR